MYKQSYIGKIKDVERDSAGKPLRNAEGDWKYKTGKDAFVFTEGVPVKDALNKIEDIIDPQVQKWVSNAGMRSSNMKLITTCSRVKNFYFNCGNEFAFTGIFRIKGPLVDLRIYLRVSSYLFIFFYDRLVH